MPWRVLPPPGAFREDTAAGVPGRRARRRKRRRRSGRTARQRASGLSAVAASPAPRHRRTGWRTCGRNDDGMHRARRRAWRPGRKRQVRRPPRPPARTDCRAAEGRGRPGRKGPPPSRRPAAQAAGPGHRRAPGPGGTPCRRTDRTADRPEPRPEKDDRLPRGRGSRPKREDVLMVRGYGEGGGCSCEPRQDQGGSPCRICCPPEAGRGYLGVYTCLFRKGPAGARGDPRPG